MFKARPDKHSPFNSFVRYAVIDKLQLPWLKLEGYIDDMTRRKDE
jgi:hypothetical protein